MAIAFLNWIRGHDYFGHPIHLNFNNKGSAHMTTIGGLFSIVIKFLIFAYLSLLIKRMVKHESDNITTNIILNEDKGESVQFSDTNLYITF